ncbi:hypothetical protein [Oceanobacillus sp. CAU 1775]
MEYVIITALIILLGVILTRVNKIENRTIRMQFKLDQVIKELNLLENPHPGHPIDDELKQLIEAGEEEKARDKAIETFGLSYQEGHHYIKVLKEDE